MTRMAHFIRKNSDWDYLEQIQQKEGNINFTILGLPYDVGEIHIIIIVHLSRLL